MTISPLRNIPLPPKSAFDAFLRQAPKAANSDGTLRLVREVAKESIVVGAKKSVLRGIFAWVGTTLANPALGVAVAVGDLLPGDTPQRPIPISIDTHGRRFDEQFMTELQKISQLAIEEAHLKIQIEHYKRIGLSGYLPFLQDQLVEIQSQLRAIAYGYGVPTVTGALNMVASADTSNDNTITSADINSLAIPDTPIEGSKTKQATMIALHAIKVAYLDIMESCGNALFAQSDPTVIAAVVNHMIERQAEFEANANAILRQGQANGLHIEPGVMYPLFFHTMIIVLDMLSLVPEKIFGSNGNPVPGVSHNLDVIRLEWPRHLEAQYAFLLREKIKTFQMVDRHVALVLNGIPAFLWDLFTMISMQSAIALAHCTDSDNPLTKYKLSMELKKLGVLMGGVVSKNWKTWNEGEVVTLDADTNDRLEILLSYTITVVNIAMANYRVEQLNTDNLQDILRNTQLFLNNYTAFTGTPLPSSAERAQSLVNTTLTPNPD